MKVTVQTVHFDATVKLEEFINKKIAKLEQYSDKITAVDVVLEVVKPSEREKGCSGSSVR